MKQKSPVASRVSRGGKKTSKPMSARVLARRRVLALAEAARVLKTHHQVRDVGGVFKGMLERRGVSVERFVRTVVTPSRCDRVSHLAAELLPVIVEQAGAEALFDCCQGEGVVQRLQDAMSAWGPLTEGEQLQLAAIADVLVTAREWAASGRPPL